MNMWQVIRQGAVARRSLPCPFCGADPPLRALPLAAQIAGRFIVACENDDCAANPQVSADDPGDAWAAAVLREAFPGRKIVPINCRDLIWGLGAFHCLTQQQPLLD